MENIVTYKNKHPKIDDNAYINPYAIVIGEGVIHSGVSLWPGVIVRADDEQIEIGENTAILDKSLIEAPRGFPTKIGPEVLVSHGVTLHGCTIERGVIIGISANVLEGAIIGEESVIAAGALVPKNALIPPRSKVVGVPGTVTGEVSDEEIYEIHEKRAEIKEKAREYGKWFVVKNI
jgi:carbonic anhydrase/acetyltransferase-like protein (isoleucine patch superfamily)